MSKVSFDQSVALATARDSRYSADAYLFLRDALDFTIGALSKGKGDDPGHVTGPELCQGVRKYAIEQYGPMVPTILDTWGIRSTRDFGELVYNLIKAGAFSKSSADRIEDFDNVYDFTDAFVKPFLPARPLKTASKRTSSRKN
jgi:uncharacterized repeat protein (TIGR04138 family)